MKTYTLNRGGAFSIPSTVMLLAITLLFFYIPIGQLLAHQTPQYQVAFIFPVLAYAWYMRLKPTKQISFTEDGHVSFTSGLGERTLPVAELESIRPFMNLGKSSFVLHHSRGAEFLFEDPTTVALVVAEIVSRNPGFQVRGVPAAPPAVS